MSKQIIPMLVAFGLVLGASSSFAQYMERGLGNRLQLEGSFATTFNDDYGYNVNLNYAPPLPGVLDGVVSIGPFWQWTFEADEIEEDANIMKLGGEIRIQKAIGAFVPYIKAEASWVRFDNSDTVDSFGWGPGAGINFWITHSFGFGAEVNTAFICCFGDDAPGGNDQITTFLVGPRIGFGGW
ncbi:MAG TPA: hypothetical protein VHT73_01300 [Thermodesulfobacteriota bacterium]|nr:hypothetical protein [Thermodesulfobacteriota bacterium]